jgi:Trk K+ transport system NAD-binding subunit
MLAAVSVRPAVIDFMDLVAISPDLRLEEVEVRQGGFLDGIAVRDVPVRFRGVVILAVRAGASTVMRPAPDPDVVLNSGDVVVALGPVTALGELAR